MDEEKIERIRERMCDKFCKYAEKKYYSRGDLLKICDKCPLRLLDEERKNA